jgi:hypothetical protein
MSRFSGPSCKSKNLIKIKEARGQSGIDGELSILTLESKQSFTSINSRFRLIEYF